MKKVLLAGGLLVLTVVMFSGESRRDARRARIQRNMAAPARTSQELDSLHNARAVDKSRRETIRNQVRADIAVERVAEAYAREYKSIRWVEESRVR